MQPVKTKEMILRYLKFRIAQGIDTVSSIDIEDKLPNYGKALWKTSRLPSAFSREWRRIRENREYMKAGIKEVKEIKSTDGAYKIWRLIV